LGYERDSPLLQPWFVLKEPNVPKDWDPVTKTKVEIWQFGECHYEAELDRVQNGTPHF